MQRIPAGLIHVKDKRHNAIVTKKGKIICKNLVILCLTDTHHFRR